MVAKARLEVAFDVAPDTDPAEPDWTDLSGRIRHSDPVETSTGGAASLRLDNRDGVLDPLNDMSPHNLVPMRHARITVQIGETTVPVWRGYVDQWPPAWRFNDATIEVELYDARVWLALQDVDVDLPRQLTHQRISALLASAGWPSSLSDVSDGVVRLTSFEQQSANILRTIEDAADAEDGWLYVAPDGKVTFRSRHHQFDGTPVADVGGENLRVGSSRASFDGDQLVNVGRVELDSGTVYEFTDAASVAQFGPRSVSVRDLAVPKSEAIGIAQWLVYRFSDPTFGLPSVALNVIDDTDLADVLAIRIGDLVSFTHSPPSGSVEFVGHVDEIAHQSREGVWRTDLSLIPYFGEGPWAQWETAEAVSGTTWATAEATEGPRWAP